MDQPTDKADRALAKALRHGRADAAAAFARSTPLVYAFVAARLGGDRQAAEEVTQETFLAAVDALERFDGRAALSTWLCGIARHKVADHYRRLQRLERVRMALEAERATAAAAPDALEQAEIRERVGAALRDLAPHQREALVLKYVDGLSTREIGAQLGLSEDAAESLLARARAAFRRAFRQFDAPSPKESRHGNPR